MDLFTLIAFVSTCFLIFLKTSTAVGSISPSEPLLDGKTLVSNGGSFELGFFGPSSSGNRYLGIWYKNIPDGTVVWVANRVNPLNDSSGRLMVTTTGVQLQSQNITVVWLANSTKGAQNPQLRLLDSGNLVLIDGSDDSEAYLWQSFDYPSDTLLPGMKLGWNLRTGLNRRLSAWKNSDDPSPGDFTWEIELQGNPEAVLWKGSQKYYRYGPWNGIRFSGARSISPDNQVFNNEFVSNEDEVYYMFALKNKSLLSRIVLNQTDYTRQRYTWNEEKRIWNLFTYLPNDNCDKYGLCGAYGNCYSIKVPACQCLEGFKPKSPDGWSSGDWSQGCVRNKPLNCQAGDGFIQFERLKLPDATHSCVNKTISLKECRDKCLQNCSCMAYTSADIRGRGSGCAIWFGDLVDIRQFQSGGQDLFIRMSASESGSRRNKNKLKIALIIATPLAALLAMLILCYYFCKSRGSSEERIREKKENDIKNEGQDEDMELPVFLLATISHATDNFSLSNKLGQGGFGPVYKGKLLDGQEVAVKRLSSSSRQGVNEFKNEVKLIAKLQHRNLVRLLGCCIEGEEKMLVYEYMPNRSLDSFIFDQTRGKELDWSKRFRIISGIARGLLYLHQDSRLRIIHRDLKASNVLLDEEMNPKISDFGTAKCFGGEQTEGSTNTVIGTYGYMAPEYAIDGLFSIKSDVFSFGVLLLEIVSGIKNRGFFQSQDSLNLIGHAWKLWKKGNPLELAAESLGECFTLSEVVRCIHISLLCLQQNPEDRPPMSSVVMMLGSENKLPQPKEPGFLLENTALEIDSSTSKHDSTTVNEITQTILEAR